MRPEAIPGRRPESALVIILSGPSTLLLERADVPGFWQSVTGSLEWGETPEQAAARELFEETGLNLTPKPTGRSRVYEILPHWRPRFADGFTHNREYEFVVHVDTPCPVVLAPDEHRRCAWHPIEEAIATVFSWTNKEALEEHWAVLQS